jgi:hypothetical protein
VVSLGPGGVVGESLIISAAAGGLFRAKTQPCLTLLLFLCLLSTRYDPLYFEKLGGRSH